MHLRSYKSEGVVIGRQEYGDVDRIIHIFSPDFGKVTLVAKGARKITSRKRGHIEMFNKIRFSAVSSKGIDIMIEVEQVNPFNAIRNNLKKVALAYYFSEVIGRIVHEGEVNRPAYKMYCDYLEILSSSKKYKTIRFDFLRDMIVLAGYWPQGKLMKDPDGVLAEIIEKVPNSFRVGKRMLATHRE